MTNSKDSRKTISLAKVVMDWAEEMMAAKGFNENFSSYVADLIRRDKEQHEVGKKGSAETASPSPLPVSTATEYHRKPKAA